MIRLVLANERNVPLDDVPVVEVLSSSTPFSSFPLLRPDPSFPSLLTPLLSPCWFLDIFSLDWGRVEGGTERGVTLAG